MDTFKFSLNQNVSHYCKNYEINLFFLTLIVQLSCHMVHNQLVATSQMFGFNEVCILCMFTLPEQSCSLDTKIDNTTDGAFNSSTAGGQTIVAKMLRIEISSAPRNSGSVFSRLSLMRFFPGLISS
jgi:hypothetical protein